jgi:arabinofuranan 3-O-arabinosyltransferase
MAANRTIARLATAAPLALMAVLAYVPMLATAPGLVSADTKQYLYLDPGRLLSSALSMWDPSVAGGTVTHQQIGYLLPQGPFYWLLAELHVPVWVAQRLWLGTLLFAAGSGVWYLARVLGLGAPPQATEEPPARVAAEIGPLAAGLVYMLSPYFLQYAWRSSALVMPWSGLGWLLGFTVLTVRRCGWRYPALFGLVVALIGATNATALLYVGLAPALYLPYAVVVAREATWRQVLGSLARLALVSAAVSLWWIAGLFVEAGYGLDVLKFTETLPQIAATSSPSDVLRGLGYWLFYGANQLGPWVSASVSYETNLWLLASSFAIAGLAFVAAVATRWRHRAYFVALVLVGLVLSVGAYPIGDPGLAGRGLGAFLSGTTAGFALRSTDRATPLLIVGIAMLIGAGVAAAARRFRLAGVLGGALVVALAVLNSLPLLSGAAVEADYSRPTQIPAYMQQAADYLDAAGNSTRVLIEPGQNFAVYNFGTTTDPIWPGLMTRPTIQRQQTIDGTAATADLLAALDLTLQQGTYEPATLVPIARLLSAGDVMLQSNLAYWWYSTPKPLETWAQFETPPAGAGAPVAFGPAVGDDAPPPFDGINEATLALPPGASDPPSIAVFPVSDTRPIFRADPAGSPLIVDGSGAGLVAAAATGLLDDNPTIIYAASLAGDPTLATEALTPGAQLVLTDSNAKVVRLWTTLLQADVGEVETAGPVPTVANSSAIPLVVFPMAPADAYTTAVYGGAVYVTASAYGSPASFTPEDAAYAAFDGDESTAWQVATGEAKGSWIEVELPAPVSLDHVDLVQRLTKGEGRWITQATLTFDGGSPIEVTLGPASRTPAGQTVDVPMRQFKTLRITIDGTNIPARGSTSNDVGFAEIRIPGVHVSESLELPGDLLDRVGTASLGHRLTIIMTRDRVAPVPPRTDPEPYLSRIFSLPTARTFTVSGTARISASISDNLVDQLLGGSDALDGAVLTSSSRLAGDVDARAAAAFDGDPATAWMPAVGGSNQLGAWLQMSLRHPVTFDQLNLRIVADGRHSVPTEIRITTNDGDNVLVPLPPIADRGTPDATVPVTVRFPRVSGSVVRFTVTTFRTVRTDSYDGGGPETLPIGIAELGVPGVRFAPENPAAPLPDVCRTDLLRIDGRPIGVRIVGTVGEAEALSGLEVEGCGASAAGVHLGPGSHTVETAAGVEAGYDLDRLVLDSAAGGGPMPLEANGSLVPAPGTLASQGSPPLPAPSVRVLSSTATSASLEVTGASAPFWLVLGESQDAGWVARLASGASLGTSQLVDGMSNGWFVRPPAGGGPFVVDLDFSPQQYVWPALIVSGAALVGCFLLACWPLWLRVRRRRGREAGAAAAGTTDQPAAGDFEDELPIVVSVLRGEGNRPPLVVSTALAVVVGLVAAALPVPPWGVPAGIATALAVFAASTFSRARSLLTVGAVACVLGVVLDMILRQAVEHLHPGIGWPASFPTADTLTWLAVLALVADVAVELVRRGGRSATPELPPPPRQERRARRVPRRPS